MTLYEIGILSHYACRVDDHPDIRRCPPIWDETVRSLCRRNLLCLDNDLDTDKVWNITARGIAYVNSLERVPLPELQSPVWATRWPQS